MRLKCVQNELLLIFM